MAKTTDWRSFDRLLLAFTLSSATTAGAEFALPLVAMSSTQSVAWMAAVATSMVVGTLIGDACGGLLADTLPKWRLMAIGTAAETFALVAISVTLLLGHASAAVLVTLGFALAASGSLSSSTESAAVRSLVADEDLPRAGQRRQARAFVTTLLGPALGGGLLTVATPLPFLVAAAAGMAALGLLGLLRGAAQLHTRTAREGSPATFALAGVRAVFTDSTLGGFGILMVVLGAVPALLLAVSTYSMARNDVPPWAISLLPTAAGAGGLAGALLLLPLLLKSRPPKVGPFSIGMLLTLGAIVGMMGMLNSIPWLIALAVIFTAGITLINPLLSFLMAYVPEDRQGRVLSTMTLLNSAPGFVAPALASVLVASYDLHALLACALLLFAAATVVLLVPTLRRIPAPAEWPDYMGQLRTHG
ncbi:MAG: MFS transporter [Microbacterium sp.]|nr:MFS transporter [Microbacterium sp.]